MQHWEILFKKAVKQLKAGKLSNSSWSFGGGTAMMLRLNHRISKDIDIFLPDLQLLGHVSPRVNDGVEASRYDEQQNFIKLYFPEGEVDFIASPAVTQIKPFFREVAGVYAYVDDPVEIVSKKIMYRADEFKLRDMFDLALVYDRLKADLLKVAPILAPKVESLTNRINHWEASEQLETKFREIDILDGGRTIRGQELEICRRCLNDIILHKDRPLEFDAGLSR